MLDVKQQKIVQDNMSLSKSGVTEITGLEVCTVKLSPFISPLDNVASNSIGTVFWKTIIKLHCIS